MPPPGVLAPAYMQAAGQPIALVSDNPAVGVVRGSERPVQRRGPPWPPLQKLVNDETGATELAVWVNEVAVGEQVRAHTHDCEEVIYVAVGQLEATLGAEALALGAGDALFVPRGQVHGFRNPGPGHTTVVASLGRPNAQTFWADEADRTGLHLDQRGRASA
jgi:quercetin dioxygenase-like cupin family protein